MLLASEEKLIPPPTLVLYIFIVWELLEVIIYKHKTSVKRLILKLFKQDL